MTVSAQTPAPPPPDAPPAKPAPQRWWHWFLVYPTVGITALSGVPTWLEWASARDIDVAFGKSADARQQQDLWSKNLLCSAAPFESHNNGATVQVAATVCKSGDVLVRFVGPGDASAYRWVPVARFEVRPAKVSWLGEAQAAAVPMQRTGDVACQWSPAPGWVVRRVRSGNQCVNERIRTATGEVVGREPVSCDAPCR